MNRIYAIVLVLAFVVSNLAATDTYWSNDAGGDWGTAGNWTAGVPGVSDDAYFDRNASFTVTAAGNQSIANWFCESSGTGQTFTFDLGANTLSISSRMFSGSPNTVKIISGTVVPVGNIVVGRNGFDGCRLEITGASTIVTNSSIIYLGWNGGEAAEVLDVSGGSKLYTGSPRIGYPDENSTNDIINVTGSGTLWKWSGNMRMGENGGGHTMNISSGAVCHAVANSTYIGYNFQGRNTVNIDGAGTIFSNGSAIYLGLSSNSIGNALNITGGGAAQSRYGLLSDNVNASNNTATVSGSGSRWDIGDGYLYVGSSGPNNTLTITNGGVVTVGDIAKVGRNSGSVGNNLIVSGGGASFNAATNLIIGDAGTGTATVGVGGTLTATNAGGTSTMTVGLGNVGILAITGSVIADKFYSTGAVSFTAITATGSLRAKSVGIAKNLIITNATEATLAGPFQLSGLTRLNGGRLRVSP